MFLQTDLLEEAKRNLVKLEEKEKEEKAAQVNEVMRLKKENERLSNEHLIKLAGGVFPEWGDKVSDLCEFARPLSNSDIKHLTTQTLKITIPGLDTIYFVVKQMKQDKWTLVHFFGQKYELETIQGKPTMLALPNVKWTTTSFTESLAYALRWAREHDEYQNTIAEWEEQRAKELEARKNRVVAEPEPAPVDEQGFSHPALTNFAVALVELMANADEIEEGLR